MRFLDRKFMVTNKNQLRIGIVLNYINILFGNLIPIFYTPIMLEILGQEEYGLYKLSSNLTSYLSLMSLGLGAALTRYLIKAREEEGKEAEERMLGLFNLIFWLLAGLTFVIGVILSQNLHIWYAGSLSAVELQRMKILVFLMVCNMALNLSMSPQISVVNTHEKFIFLQCINIVTTCCGPILNIVALFWGYASLGMACTSLILSILVRGAYFIYVRKAMGLKARYSKLPTSILKEIFVFSFWVFLSNVVAQLYNATDTIMIGAVPALSTVGVAVYNVGATFNSMVFSLTTGVSNLLTPKTNKLVFSGASNVELTNLAIKVGRIQGYIISLLVSGFVAFGKPFINFYAGMEYGAAYQVAVFMMIPNMIPLVQSVCLNIIVAQNKHRFRSIVYLGIAVLNVIGTWILMQYWGVIGAALMTGIALIIGQGLIMNWYYWKRTNLDIPRFWNEIGKIYILPIMMCIATLNVSKWIDFYQIPVFLLGVIIYTIVFVVFNWLFIMNDYEKNIILSLKIFKRRK